MPEAVQPYQHLLKRVKPDSNYLNDIPDRPQNKPSYPELTDPLNPGRAFSVPRVDADGRLP